MLSLNIADLFDKMLSFPNRGKETSLVKFSNAQNLMNGKSDIYHDMSYLCNQELIESGWINPEYSVFNASDWHMKLNSGLHRMVGNSKVNAPKLTFPHYAKVIPDFLRFPVNHTDMLFNSSNYLNYIPDFICDKTFMNPVIMADLISDLNLNFNLVTDKNSENLKKDMSNVSNLNPELTHSYVNISESGVTGKKTQELSGSHKLSQELANRKAKELHKRSKKRRRRQKKQHQISLKFESCENSKKVNLSSDATIEVDSIPKMPKSSNPRYFSDCKYCKGSDVCGKLSCSNKCENQKSDFIFDIVSVRDDTPSTVQIVLPNLSSFLISVESVADDDSDWDSSTETDWLSLTSEFELPGLFVASLTSSKIDQASPVPECEVSFTSKDLEELKKLQMVLNEVNKNWEEATKGIDEKPKLPTKVSFAPDNELVEVMPVEIYDRKGEWERYAIERTHFRRRIGELEKVLSPCLSADHRARILELRQSKL